MDGTKKIVNVNCNATGRTEQNIEHGTAKHVEQDNWY